MFVGEWVLSVLNLNVYIFEVVSIFIEIECLMFVKIVLFWFGENVDGLVFDYDGLFVLGGFIVNLYFMILVCECVCLEAKKIGMS